MPGVLDQLESGMPIDGKFKVVYSGVSVIQDLVHACKIDSHYIPDVSKKVSMFDLLYELFR